MNMEIWILVFFFKSGYGAGAGSAEFSSKERCEQAIKELKVGSRNWGGNDWAICLKK
jgi:hypothetical protein